MRNHWKDWIAIGLLSLSVPSYAAQTVDVNSLHYAQAAKQTRMIFDVSASPKHRVFVQNKALQLVIDINNGKLAKNLTQPAPDHPLFAKLHVLEKNKDHLRLAIDLKKPVTGKNFSLNTNNKKANKLIIDLVDKGTNTIADKTATSSTNKKTLLEQKNKLEPLTLLAELNSDEKVKAIVIDSNKNTKNALKPLALAALNSKEKSNTSTTDANAKKTSAEYKDSSESLPLLAALNSDENENLQKTTQSTVARNGDKIVIAIDAGHGGEDPGAHGTQGTEEKRVVFAIASKLAKLINSQPDMKAVMVRKGDYYVGLRKRMQIARKAHANLFISIHADAFQDATVKGSSVYVLSEKGASSEAALWLAKSENASDSIAGVSLEDKEDVLASVLLDLSQSATEQASFDVAQSVLKHCSSINEVHRNQVQKAGFMVLKSPDIPSILVETAFISNPDEEVKLLDTDYQNKMAEAIFQGVRNYFKMTTPSNDTKVAAL